MSAHKKNLFTYQLKFINIVLDIVKDLCVYFLSFAKNPQKLKVVKPLHIFALNVVNVKNICVYFSSFP